MFAAEYFAPKTISEALVLLGKCKRKAKLIAGGTNVCPNIRAKVIQPGVLVDISHLKMLSYVKEEGKGIRIGGLTTISELETSRIIRKYVPILSDATRQLGNPLVRNRATIGGNLADASPAADSAVPLLVLGATLIVERKGAKPRQIPIDQFFVGPNQTVLRGDEIIREIAFPRPIIGAKMTYLKLGLRNAMAISVVSVGVLVEVEKGKCSKARIALGAVAPTPRRATRWRIYSKVRPLQKNLSTSAVRRSRMRFSRSQMFVRLPSTEGPWPLFF